MTELSDLMQTALTGVARDHERDGRGLVLGEYWGRPTIEALVRRDLIEPEVKPNPNGLHGHHLTAEGVRTAADLLAAENRAMERERLIREMAAWDGDLDELVAEAKARA
jgi:hypothetical protein